ncbi:hypothetical protein [Sphingobium sp. EP60837]|uniref:hypothetical protein n=1 Tax=Sphingobium sp. EP60837 TaxID=1855519 RepID=UPI0018D33519|nr:hypothetical protein [Sphingobium sp. EP60837]
MAQRSIGQERFGFLGSERTTSSLNTLVSLIDWHAVAVLLDPLYPASKGEPAHGNVQSASIVDLV